MRNGGKVRLGILVAIVLVCGAVRPPKAQAQLRKMRLAYVSPSGAVATPWIAKEAGLFRKYGVDMDLLFIRGGSTLMQALVSGQIDIAHLAANPAMEAAMAGAPVVLVANVLNTPVGFYLMAQPGIKSLEDLKGNRLGISRFGSATDLLTRIVLAQHHLVPDQDVTLVQLGGIPEIAAGLKAKVVKAGFVSSPLNIPLREMGYGILVDFAHDVPFPFGSFSTRKAVIEEKDQALLGTMKALSEAVKIYRTDRQFSLKVLQKYTRESDPKKLNLTYDTYAPYLEKIPYVDMKGVENVFREIAPKHPAARNMKPADFVDNRYVRALDKAGFYRALWGGP